MTRGVEVLVESLLATKRSIAVVADEGWGVVGMHLTGVYLIGMYLINVYVMSVLITA